MMNLANGSQNGMVDCCCDSGYDNDCSGGSF